MSVITAIYTTGLAFTVHAHMPDAKARKTNPGLGETEYLQLKMET